MACNQIPQGQRIKCGCQYCDSGDNGKTLQPMFFTIDGRCSSAPQGRQCVTRITDWDAFSELHCGVTDPDATCGPFWVEFIATGVGDLPPPYTRAVGFLLYWDGTMWKAAWYCGYLTGANTEYGPADADFPCTGLGWSLIGTVGVAHEIGACGVAMSMIAPNLPCCADCENACYDGDDGVSDPTYRFLEDAKACDDVAIPAGTYVFERGAELPCGVQQPVGSCSYFWKTFDYTPSVECSEYPGRVGVRVVCTANDDPVEDRALICTIYCYNGDDECYEQGGTTTIPYRRANFQEIISVPDVECCCPETVTTCCCADNPWSTELTLEVRDPSNATVATLPLTYSAVTENWESGPVTIDGCVVDMFYLRCQEGQCDPGLFIDYNNGTQSQISKTSLSCDPLLITFIDSSGNCLNGYKYFVT